MPIEFRCRRCGKLLQTPDEAAGKQAKCPACEEVQPIPEPQPPRAHGEEHVGSGPEDDLAATAPGGAFNPSPEPPSEAPRTPANPFQSPGEYSPFAPVAPDGAHEYRPSIIDLGDCFSRAWAVFTDQWGMCLGVWLVVILLSFAIGWILGILLTVVTAGAQLRGGDVQIVSYFFQFVSQVISTWIMIGQIMIFLRIARGQPADMGMLFSGGPYLIPVVIAWFLYVIMVSIGMVLLIIPGIILALMFCMFPYLIIDRNLGAIAALKESAQITRGNKMTIFAIGVLLVLLILVGMLPCLLGLLIVGPYSSVLITVMYLRMTGQRIAVPN